MAISPEFETLNPKPQMQFEFRNPFLTSIRLRVDLADSDLVCVCVERGGGCGYVDLVMRTNLCLFFLVDSVMQNQFIRTFFPLSLPQKL